MKALAAVLCSLGFVLCFSSCSHQEKHNKNEAATTAYLTGKKTAPPAMNIEGFWYSPTWGLVVINQEPNGKLTGFFHEDLHIRGVVTGKNAYLALIEDDWVEYTVELKRTALDTLTGFYSEKTPFSESDQQKLTLTRIDF